MFFRAQELEDKQTSRKHGQRDRDANFPPGLVRDGLVGLDIFSRLIPSGVISNAHDRISATGKPRISSSTTSRTAQFGISKKGKTCVATWISSHATTA